MLKTVCIAISIALLGSYAGIVLYHYVPLLYLEMAEKARINSSDESIVILPPTNSTKKLDHLTSLT